ncbi:MAG TPA: hypothetical protein VIG99_16945 [Myxococcaceae bacterium]
MKPPAIFLHVDELVLHGLGGSDGEQVHLLLRRELTRVLAERGLPGAALIGAQMARTLCRAVTGREPPR